MSRAAVNACVTTYPPDVSSFVNAMRKEVKERCGSWKEFAALYGMTKTAVYERMVDPDRFTVGQLREARHVLGMDKTEFLRLVGTLL